MPAYKEALVLPVAQVATELQDVLGQRLVAFATSTKSPKMVGRWATGTQPRDETEVRLRELFRAVLMLKDAGYEPETIRAFFTSMNPDLKDQAAIEVVRSGKAGEVYHAIDAFIEA